MRALMFGLLFAACAGPAFAQATRVETLLACPTQERVEFPPNTVAVIWTLNDSADNSTHLLAFSRGGPTLDAEGRAAASPTVVEGWAPMLDSLRLAAAQRRKVEVSYAGETVFAVTVLWDQSC